MRFIYPNFLFFLFLIAIPIVVHLFNFKRFKKVYFTNVGLLKKLQEKNKKENQLKQLLVLLLRILFIVSLVFAFAQAFIPSGENNFNEKSDMVSIYVDNSFSMQLNGENGANLEQAKQDAIKIISLYKETDKFQLLTNDFEGQHQRFVSKEDFVDMLNEIDYSAVVNNINDVYLRQTELIKSNNSFNKTLYLLSDFQKSSSDLDKLILDSNVFTYFIKLNCEKVDNIYLDSCYLDTPYVLNGKNANVNVVLKNSSDIDYSQLSVSLYINDTKKTVASVDLAANSSANVQLSFISYDYGLHNAYIKIEDYPVSYDDKWYFSFSIMEQINVLTINDGNENKYIEAVFANDSLINYNSQDIKMLDYSSLDLYDLVILNSINDIPSAAVESLDEYVENDGNLTIIPSSNFTEDRYNKLLSSLNIDTYSSLDTSSFEISEINYQHPFYKDVFNAEPESIKAPKVSFYYRLNKSSFSSSFSLLKLENDADFLRLYKRNNSNIYLFTSNLVEENTNIIKHSYFFPTIYNMALYTRANTDLYNIIGQDAFVEFPYEIEGDNEIIYLNKDELSIIPEIQRIGKRTKLFFNNLINQAGGYYINDGNINIGIQSFNYDRKESVFDFYSSEEISEVLNDKGNVNFSVVNAEKKSIEYIIAKQFNGKELWFWFILSALLFILAEIIILRFWN